MAAYNAEKFISEAIQSILDQTFTDFELIIVNDGSTDKTKEKILAFSDNRIKYFENEGNIGLTKTKYKLIEKAQGKYFAMMDADDIAYPKRLELQLKAFRGNGKLGLCGTWAKTINESGNSLNENIKIKERNEELYPSLLFWNRFIHPSMMIKKECFEYFNYDISAGSAEDLDLWLKISKKFEIQNLHLILLEYRIHFNQITTLKKEKVDLDRNNVIFKHTKLLFEFAFNEKNHAYLIDWNVPFKINYFKDLLSYCQNLINENKLKQIFNNKAFKNVIHKRIQKRILRTNEFNVKSFSNYINFLFKNNLFFNLIDIYILIFRTKKTKWN